MGKTVLVPIAQGCEEMEAVIIIDMLRRAGVEVIVGGENDISTCSRGLKIVSDLLIDDIDESQVFDAIVIPGGSVGVNNLSKNQHFEDLLKIHSKRNGVIAAICAAPTLLAEKKIIPLNSNITSHPSFKNQFQQFIYVNEKVVFDNNLITSRGAGTAFEFSLSLIELLVNKETAEKIANDIVLY
ncbi:MAG: DJ-1 family glyoxalase III [FCB group bacterium]|jgi:DJ-1 family protein